MSLESRLTSVIQSIGADVKALQTASPGASTIFASNGSNQNGFSLEGEVGGSKIVIPNGKLKVGTRYRCKIGVSKTAAGTAAPVVAIKIGTNGNVFDATRASLTFAAQTGVADDGVLEIDAYFRAVGASAVLQVVGTLSHRLATTGLSTANESTVITTSAAFDASGLGNQILLAVTAGLSANWTMNFVASELMNLSP